jgi:hypothetical protein
MKAGDKVRAIKVDEIDDIYIKVGETGIIKSEFALNDGNSEMDVFEVMFDDLQIDENNPNLNHDGTYDMWRSQLEVIEEVTVCNGCEWEHWMPENSNEPWCPCDVCNGGDQFAKEEKE